jgi:hypothetical protein
MKRQHAGQRKRGGGCKKIFPKKEDIEIRLNLFVLY